MTPTRDQAGARSITGASPSPSASGDSSRDARVGVLFVCTGNICRSPLAEALFREHAMRRSVVDRFEIGSCGTGNWHAGDDADPRTRLIAARYGIPMSHTARAFRGRHDLEHFAWLVAMDRSHERFLLQAGAARERVTLIRRFDPTITPSENDADLDVPDPYYGGTEGFERMYQMLDRACIGLVEHLLSIGR